MDYPMGKFDIVKRLTIVTEWDVIKLAFIEAWKIDKENMLFWTVLNVLGH